MKKTAVFIILCLVYAFFAYPVSVHAERDEQCKERGMSGYFEGSKSCYLDEQGIYIFMPTE